MFHRFKDLLCCRTFIQLKNKIEYYGDMCGLHGVHHIFSRNYIPCLERLFWLFILSCCCLGASTMLQSALSLYSAGAVSYSVETNYLDWETPFPSLIVCEQMDENRIKSYLAKNKLPSSLFYFYKDIAFWNMKFCKLCINCQENQTCVEDFAESVKKIRLSCSELLTDCWWHNKHFSCCDRFQPIETEYGECYAFNTGLLDNSSLVTVNRRDGLPQLLATITNLVMIRVQSPYDITSVALENSLGKAGVMPWITESEIILKAEQTVSDVSVLSISQDIRGCLFKHERPAFFDDWPFPAYTYSACILYCRAVAQFNACNCTHYFIANMDEMDKATQYNCECPMGCDETTYKTVHVFSRRHSGKLPAELEARGSQARVHLANIPTLRVRRLAIRDMLGLVVDVGGVGGVFFGASLLSVIEIIYLFCIRKP